MFDAVSATRAPAVPVREPPIPWSFRWGLVLAAGFMAFTAWDQSYWWRVKEDYSFGWLVPLFVAYLVHDRWPRAAALARSGPINSRAEGPEWPFRMAGIGVGLLLTAGAALFLFGAFYRSAAGVSDISTLAITGGMTAVVLATIYLLVPTSTTSARERAVAGWRMAQLFLYPAVLWLLSAPLLSSLEDKLKLFLMHQVTSAVFSLFNLLELPLIQRGNVLVLPSGTVGVEEACSGIRSLTGCLFAGSILAAVFLDSPWKQGLLMAVSVLFAIGANLVRSIFLTSWAYAHGAASIEGLVHDATGYAVLGLTVVALLCLLPILAPAKRRRDRERVVPDGS